ncbi:kinase-like domain-containing protein [Tribonema minus]|uniref:mitogen-activated protein kinase kinase n=1 Tax=Tribonema minus TaxID=303371 RepID=A0A835YQN1_9STRA|nr:kinase-like domain-containing protein [Tribonema minus]
MSSNSGPSSSDTWETEYKGGRIVITRSGLSVLPRRGNPSYVKERWWHPGVLQVDEMRTLGRGACSVVHPARLVHEGLERPCAVKVFNLLDEEQQRQLSQEIQILVRSHEERCTALVRFLGAYQRPEGKVSIVLEYMDRGSLQDLIFRERSRLNSSGCGDGGLMPERVVASIAFQALQGLAHLHERCCMHRDIKPSNLLINSKGELKLTDFGILKELSSKHATIDAVTGTVKYMAPERLRGEPYGLAADIWSFGLVLLECASQHPFWNSSGQVEMLQLLEEQGSKGLISAGRGHLSKRFVDVIARTLDMDATKRADAEAALRLPWFVVQGVSSQRSAMTVLSLYLTKAASLADDALRKAAATTAAAAGTEALDAAAASTSMQRFSSPHITSPLTAPQSGAASPACSLHSVPSPASLKPAASVSPVSPRSAATAATEGLNTPPPMQGAHSISSV